MKLDKEEKELLDSYENDEWEALEETKAKDDLIEWAAKSVQKNKRINIRISEMDLNLLKTRAAREGIPYQTLVSSVLHKYVSGRYEEI